MFQTVRRWWRQPDHYYWITSILAARGLQIGTRKLVSTLVIARGVIPIAMLWSAAGPHGRTPETISVLVGVSSFAVGIWWQRRRWPSRNQSLVCVTVLAAGITASALTRSNAVSSAMAAVSFAALAGYVVFFHTARYCLIMLTLAAVTIFIPAARLAAAGDIVWAACLSMSAAVVTVAVACLSQVLVHLLGIKVLVNDIEPVTGLLNRDAFYDATAALIASRSRLEDRHLVVLVVSLDNYPLLTRSGGVAAGNNARVAAAQMLRETTRHDAIVAHSPDTDFLIADCFVAPDASPLVERINAAMRATPQRLTASIGVTLTPMRGLADCPPYDLLDELLERAGNAARDARSTGAVASYVCCDRPRALAELEHRGVDDLF